MESNEPCHICIRQCKIGNSFCFRRDQYGKLVHGNRLCAVSVDNLFDKPIIYFSKNQKILSIGSWGCNLRCLGCQNVNLSWNTSSEGLHFWEMQPEELIQFARENGCKGICYTFNEPAILIENIEKIAISAREHGLFNVFVTNSTLTVASTKRIAQYMDAVATDIKSMSDSFYYDYCGAQGISDVTDKILRCIRAFSDSGCHLEVRTNIIPGGNDQEENYRSTASWIRENLGKTTPWHITRFFPSHKLGYLPQTSIRSMLQAQHIGFEEGLKYVHTHFSKGCDCAKENNLIDQSLVTKEEKPHSCCCK